MASFLLEIVASLNPEQGAIAEGLAEIVDRLDPPQLDVARSSAVIHAGAFHVTLAHTDGDALTVHVHADGEGEIVVSYGYEHEHFRSEDASVGRVWPFPSVDHRQASLSLVEYLLTGRVELQVWKRPLGIKTSSYWINDDGEAELFLRGGTVGPVLGWSREPDLYRFDFTGPS